MKQPKSAVSGQFVSKKFAKANPATTITQTIKRISKTEMTYIATRASIACGKAITPEMARAVINAYRRMQ